jgi:hypothetical protein
MDGEVYRQKNPSAKVAPTSTLSSPYIAKQTASPPPQGGSPTPTQSPDMNGAPVFQSYIAEVREGGVVYKLSICLPIVQRVQFLTTENIGVVYLLFFLEGKMIHLYQVPFKRYQNNRVEITSQPNLLSYVVKTYVWSQWDPHKNYLYIIQKVDADSQLYFQDSSDARASNSRYRTYVLKLFEIPDRSFKLLWEIPLRMKLSIPKLYNQLSRANHYFWGSDHRASNPISRLIQIVQMEGVILSLF